MYFCINCHSPIGTYVAYTSKGTEDARLPFPADLDPTLRKAGIGCTTR